MQVSGRYGAVLRAVTSPEAHPALTRLVDSGVADGPTEYHKDYALAFGLHTILDGIERRCRLCMGSSKTRQPWILTDRLRGRFVRFW